MLLTPHIPKSRKHSGFVTGRARHETGQTNTKIQCINKEYSRDISVENVVRYAVARRVTQKSVITNNAACRMNQVLIPGEPVTGNGW